MKKLLHLLPLLLLLCPLVMAQTVRVIDKTTLQPLAGVAISNTSGTGSIRTDARGSADINQINSSDDKLHFSYIGYQTLILTLAQLQKLNYEVVLTQQGHNLNEVVISASKFAEEQQLVPQQDNIISTGDRKF